jgi:hypothetical protein
MAGISTLHAPFAQIIDAHAKQLGMKTESDQRPRGRGRPSLYSTEIANAICERLMRGETMLSISEDSTMPGLSTLCRWLVENPEFRELTKGAKESGTDVLADQCIRIADDPTISPQDKRVRIDTRLRLIGKWNAKKYGDRIAHDIQTETRFIPLDELEEKVRKIELERQSRVPALAAPESLCDAAS